ncbi:hypothetical protein EMIT0373P_10222 [Pseudomonas chlororaphis]
MSHRGSKVRTPVRSASYEKGASSDAPFFYPDSTHAPRLLNLKYNRFWGTHAAEYQGQFTRLDCQDHYRGHRRTDGADRFRCHFSSHFHQ